MSVNIPNPLEKVISEYGWGKPHRVYQNENTWFVLCPEGTFFLKRSNLSPEKLSWLQNMLNNIRWDGFNHLLPFIHTRNGEAIVSYNEDLWYSTPWKQNKGHEVPVKDFVRSLASFHRYAEPLAKDHHELYSQGKTDWLNQWREKKEMLKYVKQTIEDKEFPSPFDQSYSQYYDIIDQSLNFAIRGMEKFVKLENGKPPRYTLCHNRIHPSNIVYDDSKFYWVDFDHASIDSPVRDLAMLIRRFSHLAEPSELLQVYLEEFPLDRKEKKLLALYLAYPERILKELHSYNKGVKLSQEPASQKRLEKEIQNLIIMQQLVVELWPNGKKH